MSEDEAAARAILYYMKRTHLTQAQRDLLMTDYAARRDALPQEERRELDELAIALHLPTAGPAATRVGASKVPAQKRTIPKTDVAIVTILPVELRAVQTVFGFNSDDFEAGRDGTRYYETSVVSRRLHRELKVVITLAEGAYDLHAADAVSKLLRVCDPTIIFLVGISAGNEEKFEYADVVVPRTVMNYEAVRVEPDRQALRPRYENVPREVAINLNYYDPQNTGLRERITSFCEHLQPTDVPEGFNVRKFAPKVESQNTTIAVGAKLIADGRTLADLRSTDQLVVAADQESFGFARACRGHWWAVFRGVSDFGDAGKSSGWQFVAASMAALTLKDFLESEYLPPNERR